MTVLRNEAEQENRSRKKRMASGKNNNTREEWERETERNG
jgi:hypothetical protein